MNEVTNVTTGEVRLSYVHLFKPYAYAGTGRKISGNNPGPEDRYGYHGTDQCSD
ncbi:MAG: hypothetical protein V8S75_02725 [[Ruminococcus] torques]